jgi:heme/copper-type cytochrome/quinol oxidase subunit 4
MSDAAVALAILGFSVGMLFRLRILLSILALLLVLSIVFSVARGFSFIDAALTVMFVQSIVQASYFLGLVARSFARRNRSVL